MPAEDSNEPRPDCNKFPSPGLRPRGDVIFGTGLPLATSRPGMGRDHWLALGSTAVRARFNPSRNDRTGFAVELAQQLSAARYQYQLRHYGVPAGRSDADGDRRLPWIAPA